MGAALSLLDIGLTSHLQRQVWQGNPIHDPDSNITSSGFPALDLALPGAGWMPGDYRRTYDQSLLLHGPADDRARRTARHLGR